MLATMQADGTLEMKWCKCFLCTELFALSIDGTEACSTTKSGNLRHLASDAALAPLDPSIYAPESLLIADAELLDAIHVMRLNSTRRHCDVSQMGLVPQ
jgi:hypothetical protein